MAGCWVLDVDCALGEEFVGDFTFEAVVIVGVGDFFAGEFLGRFCERVEAEIGFSGLVVPLHDRDGGFFTEGLFPALEEPIRMGVEGGGVHVLKILHEFFTSGNGLAEDGVDEGADGRFACLDSFVDGGVVGDFEDEELAEADAEDVACFCIEFAFAEISYPAIEEAAVTENTEEYGLQEGAILWREHATLGVALDEGFCVIVAFRPCSECGDGGLADVEVFCRHKFQLSKFNSQ